MQCDELLKIGHKEKLRTTDGSLGLLVQFDDYKAIIKIRLKSEVGSVIKDLRERETESYMSWPLINYFENVVHAICWLAKANTYMIGENHKRLQRIVFRTAHTGRAIVNQNKI